MNKQLIADVEAEIKRFAERVKELRVEDVKRLDKYPHFYSYKHTGAVRRASMDLTRALAKLRKGRWQ